MRKLLFPAALAALLACTPKPAPVIIPTLPGDGAEHTAKPPPVITKPVVDDPWATKTLIAAPPAARPGKVELPALQEFTLSNGLKVYAVKTDRLPVMSLQLAVRAGRIAEPRARLGVSELTADLLIKGTKRRDAKAIAQAIDSVGGTITADSTFEATLLSCSVLAKDTDTCLDLLPDIVENPAFAEQELTKQRDVLIGGIHQRLEDAASLASLHVQALLWGSDHVRGWVNSERSVASLRREDVIAWHKAWYVPNNALLVVSGDFDPKRLRDRLERAFSGGWAKAPVPVTPTYPEPGLSGIRIRLVDKPGQTQTHIRIAQFGIKHDDPRFFDTVVWNYILGGGGLGSRLTRAVRIDAGKAAGASTSFDRNVDKGSYVAQTYTRNADAVATIKLMTAEIAKMQKEGPAPEEIAAAAANIAGAWGLRFQSASDIGGALIGAELHGFGMEYLQNYGRAIGAVDVESAKRVAAEVLDPKNYVIVLVGDAKDLEPQLRREGWRFERVAFTEPITPEIKEAAPVAAVEDPKTIASARKLIDEAVAAKGGAKLGAIKSLRMAGKGTTTQQNQTIAVTIGRTLVVPDKMRIDAKLQTPIGEILVQVGVANGAGWQLGPDPSKPTTSIVVDIPKNDMVGVEFDRWRDPEMILLHAQDKDAKLTLLPEEPIDGKPQQVVKVTSPYGNIDVTLYLDKKTHLMTRMVYAEGLTSTDEFADYRDVSGIKVAFTRNSHDANRDTKLTMDKIEIDPTIPNTTFDKPNVAAAPPATPAPAPAPAPPKATP